MPSEDPVAEPGREPLDLRLDRARGVAGVAGGTCAYEYTG
jgi:hypothetical protein